MAQTHALLGRNVTLSLPNGPELAQTSAPEPGATSTFEYRTLVPIRLTRSWRCVVELYLTKGP